jgi:hypothetical protein
MGKGLEVRGEREWVLNSHSYFTMHERKSQIYDLPSQISDLRKKLSIED